MLSNCLLSTLVTVYLILGFLQVISAKAIPYDEPAVSAMLNDADGLQKLLDVCRLNPDLCVQGGRVDGVVERLLHKLGITRLESHFMLDVLRGCLEDINDCEVEATILKMIKVPKILAAVKSHRDIIINTKKAHHTRSILPSIRHHKGIQNGGLAMYSRYGRTDRSAKRQKRSNPLSQMRVRRTWNSFFNEAIRGVCKEERCHRRDSDNNDLPESSEY